MKWTQISSKSIAAHCKKQSQPSSPKPLDQSTSKSNDTSSSTSITMDNAPPIISMALRQLRVFNVYYDLTIALDRNRLTILMANTLKLLALPNGTDCNFLSFGFALSDISEKQLFYRHLHVLWRIITKTLAFYRKQCGDDSISKSIRKKWTTHFKLLINFQILFLDTSKWRISRNTNGNPNGVNAPNSSSNSLRNSMVKCTKKYHPSFLKKYIANKPRTFYREWKETVLFCQGQGLSAIASSALESTVIISRLSPDLLREFMPQILSIPHLAATHRHLFVRNGDKSDFGDNEMKQNENDNNSVVRLSEIWQRLLPLVGDEGKRVDIRISGSMQGIPNGAWFISNCSCLIEAVQTMKSAEFEYFVSFFSRLLGQFMGDLAFNEVEVEEKQLRGYMKGFGHLYDGEIISKLFWSIFDPKVLDTAAIAKVRCFCVYCVVEVAMICNVYLRK